MQVDEASQVTMDETLLQWAKLVVQGGSHIDIEDGSSFGADYQPITVVEEGTATIARTRFMEGGVDVLGSADGAGSAQISASQFVSAPGNAVRVEGGASATLWDNDFTGNHRAVTVIGSAAEVRDSTFLDNRTSLEISGSGGEYRQNEISGGVTGIELKDGGDAFIAGNTVDDARSRGIVIGAGTSPTVEGNRFCGSMVNVLLEEGAAPVFGENEVCPDRAMGD